MIEDGGDKELQDCDNGPENNAHVFQWEYVSLISPLEHTRCEPDIRCLVPHFWIFCFCTNLLCASQQPTHRHDNRIIVQNTQIWRRRPR